MKRTVVVFGPLPAQFDRVIRALPKADRDAFRFRCFDGRRRNSLPQADVFILWTKFAKHATDTALSAWAGRDRFWRTTRWSVKALRDILKEVSAGVPSGAAESEQS